MATEVEAFLRAEQSANELLGSLKQLQKEIEGYSTARGSLEDVRVQLVSLVQTLSQNAEQSTAVMSALEKVGTSEILKQIENVISLNEKNVSAVESLSKAVSETLPQIESKLAKSIAENAESLRKSNATMQNQMSEQIGAMGQQINAVSQQSDSVSKGMEDMLNKISITSTQVEQQARTLKLMIGIGLPLVALIVSGVLIVLKNL